MLQLAVVPHTNIHVTSITLDCHVLHGEDGIEMSYCSNYRGLFGSAGDFLLGFLYNIVSIETVVLNPKLSWVFFPAWYLKSLIT